ncbi:MAG TPA: nucleoside hydrolase [Pelolinea sp.]|nr:nucleoside hydrolase [Pelolinea sp.]
MARNIIIDCDTGMDDALALLLALRSPEFNVLGITCVNGNVTLDKVVINTLKVVEHSGKSVPVYAGAVLPLLPEKSQNAPEIHGTDGLGNIGFPEPGLKAEKENAIDFIIRTLMDAKEPMDWITLGPFTNAALAVRQEPRILEKIKLLTMMAGAVDFGNTKPMSEFNVFADPEATKIVFDSEIPKLMVPLDPLWHGGQVNREEIQQIAAREDLPWCRMASRLLARSIEMAEGSRRKYAMGEGAVAPPDLLTIAVTIDPGIGHYENYQVFVETAGQYTRGMTMLDRRWNREFVDGRHANQMTVCLSADQKKYGALVVRTWLG